MGVRYARSIIAVLLLLLLCARGEGNAAERAGVPASDLLIAVFDGGVDLPLDRSLTPRLLVYVDGRIVVRHVDEGGQWIQREGALGEAELQEWNANVLAALRQGELKRSYRWGEAAAAESTQPVWTTYYFGGASRGVATTLVGFRAGEPVSKTSSVEEIPAELRRLSAFAELWDQGATLPSRPIRYHVRLSPELALEDTLSPWPSEWPTPARAESSGEPPGEVELSAVVPAEPQASIAPYLGRGIRVRHDGFTWRAKAVPVYSIDGDWTAMLKAQREELDPALELDFSLVSHDPLTGDRAYFLQRSRQELARANVSLYEGLPHPRWEAELFAREKSLREYIGIYGEFFYAEPQQWRRSEDAERFLALLHDPAHHRPESATKQCGGFHADWALHWESGDGWRVLMLCFGCGEWTYADSSGIRLAWDMAGGVGPELQALFARYRQTRPRSQASAPRASAAP